MRRTLLRLTLAVFAAGLFTAQPTAQGNKPAAEPAFVAIFDLRTEDASDLVINTDTGAAAMFPASLISKRTADCKNLPAVLSVEETASVLACAVDSNQSIADRAKAAELIAGEMKRLRKASDPRVISTKGTTIRAFVIQKATLHSLQGSPDCVLQVKVTGRKSKFAFKEETRKTQIASDLETLGSLVAKIGGTYESMNVENTPPEKAKCGAPFSVEKEETAWLVGRDITLTLERATVTLDATLLSDPAKLASDPSSETPAIKDANKAIAKEAADEAALEQAAEQKIEAAEFLTTVSAKCPPEGAAAVDPVAQAICLYKIDQEAGVEMLAKLSTPKRAAALRWILQNNTRPVIQLKAGAALGAALADAPAADKDKDKDKAKEVTGTTKFLSGPAEHWSLSANVFVSKKTKIKKDGAAAVELADAPPEFYVSLNFLAGDVHSSARGFLGNLELKLLAQGSKSPLDSIGIGLGVRGARIKHLGIDFETLSPFAGVTWTRADRSESRSKDRTIRFGVSLNLNKALDWVK